MISCPEKCEEKEEDGLCPNHKSLADGLNLRCVGEWSLDKLEYFKYYAEMFSTSMKDKWGGNLGYMDFFSGPGRCIVKETCQEVTGSPINALNVPNPFKKYYFVDIEKRCIDDLKIRAGDSKAVKYFQGDCNNKINEIIDDISDCPLSLAIIDPSSLQFNFDSYRKLAGRKVDLIVNYPINPFERAVSSIKSSNSSVLDNFHPGWRSIYQCKPKFGSGKNQIMLDLIKDYIKKICELGYISCGLADFVSFKNSKNSTLYYLIYFSKHPLGIKFWQYARKNLEKKRRHGQRTLGI